LKDVRKRRWFKALEIAKILFEDQGYHTRYLEEIENHIGEEVNGQDYENPECQVDGKGQHTAHRVPVRQKI